MVLYRYGRIDNSRSPRLAVHRASVREASPNPTNAWISSLGGVVLQAFIGSF